MSLVDGVFDIPGRTGCPQSVKVTDAGLSDSFFSPGSSCVRRSTLPRGRIGVGVSPSRGSSSSSSFGSLGAGPSAKGRSASGESSGSSGARTHVISQILQYVLVYLMMRRLFFLVSLSLSPSTGSGSCSGASSRPSSLALLSSGPSRSASTGPSFPLLASLSSSSP